MNTSDNIDVTLIKTFGDYNLPFSDLCQHAKP